MKLDIAEHQTQLMSQFHGAYSHPQVRWAPVLGPGKESCRALGRRQGQAVASLCRADPVAEGHGDRRDQEFPGIWSVLGVTSGKVS